MGLESIKAYKLTKPRFNMETPGKSSKGRWNWVDWVGESEGKQPEINLMAIPSRKLVPK